MRKGFLLLAVLLSAISGAQTFPGTGGAIQNTGNETYFNLPISGMVPSQCDSVFGLEQISLDITHPSVDELDLYLKSPSGKVVQLTGSFSNFGSNYTGTCFDNHQLQSVTTASAPYTGTFRPMGNLGRFNVGDPSNGIWTLIVKDWLPGGGSGTVNSWSLKFSNNPQKPLVFKSSNLPILIINTNNQALSTNSILATFGVIDNGPNRNNVTDPWNGYNGKIQIHYHGSSSMIFEKKGLKIDLVDASGNQLNASILGMPAESDWVLIAGYTDKTLVRNALSQYVFQSMGHYSPRFKMVEVILNGEYYGVYTLLEKPKRNTNRVNISKLTPVDNYFPDVTGGYILQIDRNDSPGWNSLYPGVSPTNQNFFYKYDYPKSVDLTLQQKNYIRAVTDSFETAMNSATYADPNIGYPKYIDVASFIDMMILNEFSKNNDGYRLSNYLYKDKSTKGGKLHAGPAWDYDIAWHNCNGGNSMNIQFWQYDQPADPNPSPVWWTKFMQDNSYKNQLYCRWNTHRLSALSSGRLLAFVDSITNKLSEAQARNFIQFPIMGAYIYPNPQPQAGASYSSEVADLKNWITGRGAWLDANIPGTCNTIGIKETTLPSVNVSIYPNPFPGVTTVAYSLQKAADVRIEILNALGERVMLVSGGKRGEGEYKEEINASSLAEGSYILQFTCNGATYRHKIVKL